MTEVMRILPMSAKELLDEWFESDVVKGTLAAAAITGVFQGPIAAGTAYTFLHQHVGTPKERYDHPSASVAVWAISPGPWRQRRLNSGRKSAPMPR